jgi:filamentous hemagglutinin family protein
LIPLSVQAQVTPDDTLPDNSAVTTEKDKIQIEGGTTRGNNLFHSFQEFSVPADQEAQFNNADTIENILSRVTGASESVINGGISANGSANVFLINPAGIIFGENASLNVGGSFIGSTADSLLFPDDSEYSATNTDAAPVLTINAPIGLGFRDAPQPITNSSLFDVDNSLLSKQER